MPIPSPAAADQDPSPAGPLLPLLARALEFWLRQRCEAVEQLDLKLEGTLAQLLRGHLQGARLQARQVAFQDLSLERVDLRSEPIQIGVARVLRGQSLRLEEPFLVRGSVVLTGEGLSRSLGMPQWGELADLLSRKLLEGLPLAAVQLQNDHLIFLARRDGELQPVQTHLLLTSQGLQVCAQDGRPALPIPMDAAIRLNRAEVRNGLLELAGEALVQP
jgi:hypothetical protein